MQTVLLNHAGKLHIQHLFSGLNDENMTQSYITYDCISMWLQCIQHVKPMTLYDQMLCYEMLLL